MKTVQYAVIIITRIAKRLHGDQSWLVYYTTAKGKNGTLQRFSKCILNKKIIINLRYFIKRLFDIYKNEQSR